MTRVCSREMVHVQGRAASGAKLVGVPPASLLDLSPMVPS
jgi:hypothetical protein